MTEVTVFLKTLNNALSIILMAFLVFCLASILTSKGDGK